jgi:hypothetical protein
MRKLIITVFIASCIVSITRAQAPAQTVPNPKDYTAHVVGYAHMDMAWLWRWEECGSADFSRSRAVLIERGCEAPSAADVNSMGPCSLSLRHH